MENLKKINVLGGKLIECSKKPMTGYFRNGCCDSSKNDLGKHIICAVMNDRFLEFQLLRGNDLITPKKDFDFPGLKKGDKWCVCANRWYEAYTNSCATSIILSSTHIDVLNMVDLEILKKFAIDLN